MLKDAWAHEPATWQEMTPELEETLEHLPEEVEELDQPQE